MHLNEWPQPGCGARASDDREIRSQPRPRCYLCNAPGELLYEGLRDRPFGAPEEWSFDRILPIPEQQYRICADAYLAACCPFVEEILFTKRPLGQMRIHGSNNITFARSDAMEHDAMVGACHLQSIARVAPTGRSAFRRVDYNIAIVCVIIPIKGDSPGIGQGAESAVWRAAAGALRANLAYSF